LKRSSGSSPGSGIREEIGCILDRREVFRRGLSQEIVNLFFCHTLKFCDVGDDCVQRSCAEFVVKWYGNPESSIFNNFTHLDMTSGLPKKRKSEFFKDFDCLETTNNRVPRQ